MKKQLKKLSLILSVFCFIPLSFVGAETPTEKGWNIMKKIDETMGEEEKNRILRIQEAAQYMEPETEEAPEDE